MAFGDADASTPAYVKANAVSKAVTTASFTPPVGAWLVACVVHDTAGGNLTNTSATTDSQGLTWTRVATRSKGDDGAGANNGHIAVSIAKVTTSVAMTVTTTGTNTNNPAGLYVRVITGADAVTLMDATPTEGSNTNAVISQAITVATNGARVMMVACDWNLAANMTAGSGQTAVVSDGIGAPDMRWAVIVQNAVSAPGAVTMSTASPPTGNTNNYIVIALRPATGGGSPSGDASLAVTASFGTSATSDKPVASSLALTASVSVSATKDVPVAASVAVTASVATTAARDAIAAASLAVTATVAATGAVGILATLAVTVTRSTSATPTRVAATSVSVAAAVATSIVDSRTTTAGLALTVALVASASVNGTAPPVVGGTIVAGDVATTVRALHIAAAVRAVDVAASPIGVTEEAGVIHGL